MDSQEKFPDIAISGAPVEPRSCIEEGTGLALFVGYLLSLLAALVITAVTYGIALIAFLLSPLLAWIFRRRAMALIHGSGIQVNEHQFPEIHACVKEFCGRLGITRVPTVYIIEASVANAAAVRYGKQNVILLTDDLVSGFLLAREPKALAFILGHELGHIVLGHLGMIRAFLRGAYKKLARCDEYSADRIGAALVGNADIAFNGILLLTSGAQLMPFVNRDQVKKQAEEVAANKHSKKAERKLAHPLLLNRLRRVLQGQP